MIFLGKEKGRTMCCAAVRSVWFGSLDKEWAKSAPGLEPTIMQVIVFMVPGGGVEPPRGCPRRILSPLRLPVPPSRPCLLHLEAGGFARSLFSDSKSTLSIWNPVALLIPSIA